MKKTLPLLLAAATFAACNNAPNANKAQTGDKQAVNAADGAAYVVDTTSLITWAGSKPVGTHTGTFNLKDGALIIKDNKLIGGNFTIDITSLNAKDLAADADNKAKLEGHLKSPDFFDIAKYPTAKFEITGVQPFVSDSSNADVVLKGATNIISGNLTLKDSTKNISFPAKVIIDEKGAAATADFKIDRTLWGMNYKGPNNPQDWFISKTVNIKLSIAANNK
jgi:polyisoprenoid-binding protein YceI